MPKKKKEEQPLAARIERALAASGYEVIVEEDGRTIRLEGRVDTAEARTAATDVAAAFAPDRRIENNLEIETSLPDAAPDTLNEREPIFDLPRDLDEARARGGEIEPDFTDQALATSATEMAGEASAGIEASPEDEEVFFPPTDPVITTDDDGETRVLGGFSPTSMSDDRVARSALDADPGDEAIADAVRRELREDALTTDLVIRVAVRKGVVRLRGAVPSLDDAESAEEVAGRVEGVREVVEELDVASI
jgi:osmotically-inducible protein OsmY